MYSVGHSTAARWVAAARAKILEGMRRALVVRCGIATPEVDSLVKALSGEIDSWLDKQLR
jgi:hypothetical protein